MRRRAVLVAGLLLAAGCGDAAGAGDDGRMTSRAVAAVMLDHLPDDTSTREATFEDESSPAGFVGADLRYDAGEGYDGALVRATVQEGTALPRCEIGTCADLGAGLRLRWEKVAPEEDPGLVDLSTVRDGAIVRVLYLGDAITGDPRRTMDQELYDSLVAIARDERLRLDPDEATLAAGRDVRRWKGGEVDPKRLEQVPNDDQTVVTEFIWGWGDGWEYVGPSPLKGVFGTDAIGGRAKVSAEGFEPVGPGFVDALAAPQPPAWLRTCLPAYTCRTRGADTFAWRAARGTDPGDAWMVHVNEGGDTVALHTIGRRLSDRERQARGASGGFMWGSDFWDRTQPLSVGLTATRQSYQKAKERRSGADR